MGSAESIPVSGGPEKVQSGIAGVRTPQCILAIFLPLGVALIAVCGPVFADASSLVPTARPDRVVPLHTIGVQGTAAATEEASHAADPVAPPTVVKPDAMLAAMNGFSKAMSARTDRMDDETEAALRSTRETMQRESAAYIGAAAKSRDSLQSAKLRGAIDLYVKSGNEIVQLSDKRRRLQGDYTQLLVSIKTSLKQAVDHSFKLFGRVVSRQYLVQMSTDFDAVLALSASIDLHTTEDDPVIAAITSNEAKLASTLKLNEISLVRAEGAEWLARLQEDLAQSGSLRSSLLHLNQQIPLNAATFAQASASVRQLAVPVIIPATVVKHVSRQATVAPLTSAPQPAPAMTAAPAMPAASDPLQALPPGPEGAPQKYVQIADEPAQSNRG